MGNDLGTGSRTATRAEELPLPDLHQPQRREPGTTTRDPPSAEGGESRLPGEVYGRPSPKNGGGRRPGYRNPGGFSTWR